MEDVYPPQLLQQLIPNFPQSLLTLKLGNQWQTLSARQKQITLETLWQRSQRLSFQKLRIYDRQGNLLARSPVVGKDLVILTPLASVQPAA